VGGLEFRDGTFKIEVQAMWAMPAVYASDWKAQKTAALEKAAAWIAKAKDCPLTNQKAYPI
jgi:hypothetical protein